MDFNSVLNQWIDLAKVFDKPQNNNVLNIIRQLNDRVKEAMDYDATGLSGIFIINNVLEDYLENKKLSLQAIVSNLDRFNLFLEKYRTLRNTIDDPEVSCAWSKFTRAVEHSVKGMGLHTDKLQELLRDRYQMAQLRISALVAADSLRIDQFSRGVRGEKDTKIHYGTDIFRFFDINYMLKYFARPVVHNGIYFCLILDEEEELFSYFCFVIKNGMNLYTISDKPKMPSVNYRHAGRRKGRERNFEDRVLGYYFPYELLDIEWDDEEKKYLKRDKLSMAIQEYKADNSAFAHLKDLQPETIVWINMLFGLFQKKFFGEETWQKNHLSYSAMMIDVPGNQENINAITTLQNSSIMLSGLELPVLNSKAMRRDNSMLLSAWESNPVNVNAWMEDNFAEKITDDQLVPFADPGKMLYLLEDGKLVEDNFSDLTRWERERIREIPSFSLNEFGTRNELQTQYVWYMRKLQATIIQRLAMEDYKKSKENTRGWYKQKVHENMGTLKKAIAFFGENNGGQSLNSDPGNHFKLKICYIRSSEWYEYCSIQFYQGEHYSKKKCYFTGMTVSLVAKFVCRNSEDIANICCCKNDDLPLGLQNVNKEHVYTGNSILSTLDPMDHLKNPWSDDNYNVMIFLSKTAYNNICKKFGTKPVKIVADK